MASSRYDYYTLLQTYLPDNSSQQISPQDVRFVLTDLVESIPNFITDRELSALNLASPDIRSTRFGDFALDNNTYNEDNSAFGYYTLSANYSGVRNTALGSYALGCNLYGSDNIALGFTSSAGNLSGSGNVALGNYTLRNNKYGHFNIAIGHGAGALIRQNDNYKFFLGAYPVSSGDLCTTCPQESGFTHLMYGELDTLRLGVGVKTLHDKATLQVSGNASPSTDKVGNLGHPYYMWGNAYIASGLGYSSDSDFIISRVIKSPPHAFSLDRLATFTSDSKIGFGSMLPSGSYGLMTVGGNILPSLDKQYSLGHPDLKWNGVFGNIIVSGTAQFNVLSWLEKTECYYQCKTLHLASSGLCGDDIFDSRICGYLSDEGVDGAGFEVHTSGSDYRRDYRFIYRSPDQDLSCLEQDNVYSRSRWESNISIGVTNGNHLQTQRVLSKNNLSLVSQSGCLGAFIRPNRITFGREPLISSGNSEFNFIAGSGFSKSNIAHGSGLTIKDRFLSRNGTTGFDVSYIDAQDVLVSGRQSDRFVISSVDANNRDILTILRSGAIGISNANGGPFIPQTIFNIQSVSGCDARLTAYGLSQVSLQMLAQINLPVSGFEIQYQPRHPAITALNADGPSDNNILVDFSIISPSGASGIKEGAISIAENNFVGMGTTRFGATRLFSPNAPLTIRHNSSLSGTVSLAAQSVSPVATVGYGKIYVKPVAGLEQLYFMDDTGNEVVVSPGLFEQNLYVDDKANTYGGNTPNSRPLGVNVNFNAAYGHKSLAAITNGSGNVAIGSAEDLTTGSLNVFVGHRVAKGVVSANRNVVLGADQFNSTGGGNNNIAIGHGNANDSTSALNNMILIGSGLNTNLADNVFQLGFGSSPILTGSLGGGSRNINARDASLSVWSDLNNQELRLFHNKRGTRYVSNVLVKDTIYTSTDVNYAGLMSFQFADSNNLTRILVDFDHKASSLAVTPNFNIPSPARPFVGVSGDIRLLGAMRFADGTFLDTANVNAILNFYDLPDALTISNQFTTANSYMALSVPSGGNHVVGRITLQSLADFVGSGFAAVSNNCNHIWSNAENNIDKLNNSASVFIGCNVAVGATGWKNSVMIGTEAGKGATTPNTDLATDTACIYIGYRAGMETDQTDNTIAIGTNAGYNAYNSSDSIYLGVNAGIDMHGDHNIGIGTNAIRGSGASSIGTKNIEIVAGLLDNQRLLFASGNLNNRLNIQNTIAGDTLKQKISIGHATLDPDAPLSVRRNSILVPAHGENNFIQTWWCNGSRVAYIDCAGNFYGGTMGGGGGGGGSSVSGVIEGIARNIINAPLSATSPTSGIVDIKDGSWNTYTSVWVVNKDKTLTIPSGAYVQAVGINGTYRPQWVSCSG